MLSASDWCAAVFDTADARVGETLFGVRVRSASVRKRPGGSLDPPVFERISTIPIGLTVARAVGFRGAVRPQGATEVIYSCEPISMPHRPAHALVLFVVRGGGCLTQANHVIRRSSLSSMTYRSMTRIIPERET